MIYQRAKHALIIPSDLRLEVPLFVIGSNVNGPRMRRFSDSAKRLDLGWNFRLGVDGAVIPRSLCRIFAANYDDLTHRDKTIGCSLSHLRLWEEIAASDARGALIAEDDAIFIFHPQHVIDQISDRTDRIVFMNNRMMDYDLWQANGIRLGDASDIRKKLRGPIGTDGYFIGRSAAARAVTLVSSQGIRNVVDGFILSDLNGSLGKQRSLAATPAPVEHADENYI